MASPTTSAVDDCARTPVGNGPLRVPSVTIFVAGAGADWLSAVCGAAIEARRTAAANNLSIVVRSYRKERARVGPGGGSPSGARGVTGQSAFDWPGAVRRFGRRFYEGLSGR